MYLGYTRRFPGGIGSAQPPCVAGVLASCALVGGVSRQLRVSPRRQDEEGGDEEVKDEFAYK